MAMRTATPWPLSLVFGLGLVFVFLGERLFAALPGTRMLVTVSGVVLVVVATLVRVIAMKSVSGSRQRVERTLLLCQLGALAALVLYAAATDWGMHHFHFTDKGEARFHTAVTVLWVIAMLGAVVPMLMIELSLGLARRTGFDFAGSDDDEAVEYYRVREIGWAGLSVALAAAFLMVTCNVANQRNIQRDVSYFKTSSPGDSSKKIAALSSDPIKVLLFFPDTNEVKDQVKDYFEALGHVTVEVHDRMRDAELAGKYKVTKDGIIVLVKGTGDKEKSQTIEVDTDLQKARTGAGKLRNFDREANQALMKLAREKRKAYVVKGHGEMTDPESLPPELKGRVPDRRTSVMKKRLGELNYEIKDLQLVDLAKDVPDDATMVILMAPTVPLQPAEWAALGRYLDKGGRLLLALDPKAEPTMGELEGKFGLKFNPAPLTDDQSYLPQRGSLADRRFVITTQVSSHASTTQVSRAANSGLVVVESGALEDAAVQKGEPPKKTITIHSNESSFLDLNDNFEFDAASEKRQKWNLAAALEGPKLKGADGKDRDGWRALVFADSDLFADALVQAMGRAQLIMIGGPVFDDSVRWLGGEEVFAGEVVTEDDKPIQHSKAQDAVWFTLIIGGVPLLVLAAGLLATRFLRGRRPQGRTASEGGAS